MDAKLTVGEPRVIISRNAILHNAALLRRLLQPSYPRIAENQPRLARKRLCAMIKADAYGHGFGVVVDALQNFAVDEIEAPVVDMLAVASISEAERLPHTELPVLIFRPVENCYLGRQRQQLEMAIRNRWVLTICSAAAAEDVARIAVSCSRRALIQVFIDTGMTRSGVGCDQVDHLLQVIENHASLKLVGLCTHLALSEAAEHQTTHQQLQQFHAATDGPAKHFGARVLRHVANSGGMFFHRDSHFDMVRPGIALYGIDPTGKPSVDRPLQPALRWTAPLIDVREVKAGAGVGYGLSWRAERDTRIGLIPVGYADGYLRCFGNAAMMLVHGISVPVVGNVSMDLTTIDLAGVPHAVVGDEVTLLASDPLSPASVYALAKIANTIPYEILCRIGARIHRVSAEAESESTGVATAEEIDSDDTDDHDDLDIT